MRRWGPLLAVLVLLVTAAPAAAETFTVTTTADSTGPCTGTACESIRRALAAAEQNEVPDTIVIPAGDYGLNLGVLTVDSPVTIRGAGARATRVFVTDEFPDRVFDVSQPVPVAISHLTMEGGTGGFGGNLQSVGTVMLDHVRATGGSATSGGGLANVGGTMTVQHSVIDHNDSLSGGGDSGGIANIGQGADLTVRDSTIAANRAHLAGAIFAWGSADIVTRLVHVTVVGNEGGYRGIGGVGYGEAGQTFSVRGSIIAGNTVSGEPSNCGGQILPASEGANVVSSADCGFAAAGDVVADPQLTLVTTAETDVFSLAATSPAVDRAGACTGTDQRDLARPQGGACDSGAYELEQAATPTPTPTPVQVPLAQPSPQDPEPEFKKTVVVDEVSGIVKVRLKGSSTFISLDDVRDIPMGSEIDARKGVVELASLSKAGAPSQTARFSEGVFRVTQSGPITLLTLTEKLSCPTGQGATAAAKKVTKRRLWGDGKGRFQTKGKHSAATVVGTRWLVEDRCDSTLTRVVRGKVKVRDFVKKKTVLVKAGRQYVARQRSDR